MDFLNPESLRNLALFLPVLILSLSIHEFAHAWSANRLGDATAKYLGRMTIDPMVHISFFGTILFPAISLLTGAPLFGWANPVPVDSRNFKKPRSGLAIVSFAGPLSNILISIFCTALLSILVHSGMIRSATGMAGAGVTMLTMAIQLNLFLAFFNLLPVPPLDGAKVLQGFVSAKTSMLIDRYATQGQILLLILFFTGLLRILAVPVYACLRGLFGVFQIPMG